MFVATLRLDLEAVALEHTLTEAPAVEVRAERIAAHSTKWTMPCLWVTADDFDVVDAALADDPSVEAVTGETEFEQEKYYQLDWSDEVEERVDAYLDQEASILNARANGDGWHLRIRFVTREQFDQFRSTLQDRGHSFELLSLVDSSEGKRPLLDLTPAQRAALQAAQRRGYYRVPREVTLRELADELDMSHQNLSNLLRRATEKLIDKSFENLGDAE